MQVKSKNGLKVVIIAIALLLCLALAIGITGAFYQAKRQATGTLSMDQGIIIDYKGFNGSETGATWERGTTFELFSTKAGEVQPGAHIKVNAASIKANAESVNFYARVRLEYKFYNGETEVTLEDPTVLIKTSNLFGSNWEFSSMAAPKDYYYYVENGTTTFKTMVAGADFVELIQSNAEFIIEGEGFVGADNNGASGGFVVGNTSINKIVVNLVLETLQGDATAEQAKALGWEITTGGTEGENVVELTPEDYTSTTTTDDATGEEKTIYTPSETFVEKNPKYAFTFSLNDADKTATITGPVGRPTELDIPSKIIVNGQDYTTTSIGYRAFYGCTSLTSITIPDSVTSIGMYAFRDCTGLTSITIPDSVTSIGSWAFMSCSGLTSINVDSKNPKYHSAGNCLIETARNALIAGCKNSEIPSDGSVTSIGYSAFYGCTSLTSITIPDSVTSIGMYAFRDCTGLTSITIPDSVTSIIQDAFRACTGLTSINVDSKNTRYHSAGNCLIETDSKKLIAGCNNSVIPTDGSVTCIAGSAFEGCSGLTSITIPDSVTSIGSWAFYNCSSLEEIKVAEGNANYHSAGNCLIETASKTLITGCKNSVIPTDGSVTSIGEYAFYGCTSLTSITIPDSVTSIGNNAFESCSGLTSVTIDSATIAALRSSNTFLLFYATKVYVKSDIKTVGSCITGSFEKAATSDKAGYDMYTKKA